MCIRDRHDPYKVATRRAAFMFADRERSQLVLSNLTIHRNRFVHVGSETEDIESLVFQLKRYVDSLLRFHLGNGFGFDSRSEAARFMEAETLIKCPCGGTSRRPLKAPSPCGTRNAVTDWRPRRQLPGGSRCPKPACRHHCGRRPSRAIRVVSV